MEFQINRNAILEKLSTASGAILPNSPMAELSGLLIQVMDNHIEIVGSCQELSIKTVIYPGELTGLQIKESGSIILPPQVLLELIRKLDGDSIKFETLDKGVARISNENGEFTLLGKDGVDYPLIDFTAPDTKIILSADDIHSLVNQISFACGDVKASRPVLKGIHMRSKGGMIECVATDSYRLALKNLHNETQEEFKVTIPKRTFQEVLKNLTNHDGSVECYIGKKSVQFLLDKTIIQSQVFEGSFPEVKQSIPKEFPIRLEMKPNSLIGMLDRACLYKEDTPICNIQCNGQELIVNARSNTLGNSQQVFYDFQMDGEPFSFIVNAAFLLQALKGIQAQDTIIMEINSAMKPFRITNPKDDSLEMIVVPLRANY